jgi:hypothetical protein
MLPGQYREADLPLEAAMSATCGQYFLTRIPSSGQRHPFAETVTIPSIWHAPACA